jgi:hypothetical protein
MPWATTSWEKVLTRLNCLTNLISFRVGFFIGAYCRSYEKARGAATIAI